MIEQAPSVFGHDRGAITLRVVQLLALPMPPIVEGNDAAAACHQRTDPARVDPIGRNIGRKAVDEQDRFPLSLIPIGDAHAVRLEARHSSIAPDLRRLYSRATHSGNM